MGEKKKDKEIFYPLDAALEVQLVSILRSLKKTITTAESLTGGMVSAAITSVEGASDCFKVGYVTYSNKSKRKLLSVKKELLRKEGAVSAATAKEMAIGAMMESEADIAVALTGNAGPGVLQEIGKRFASRRVMQLCLWLEIIFWKRSNASIKRIALWQ